MRYAPKAVLHPIIGPNVQVCDLRKGGVVTIYTGAEAWPRAEARCDKLNAKEAAIGSDVG